MTAGCAIHRGIPCQPHGEMSGKTSVEKVQLRRLCQALERVISIRTQKIYYTHSLQQPQPLLRGMLCNLRRIRKRLVINLLKEKFGTGCPELPKSQSVCNAAQLCHIAHDISVNIGIKIFLTLLRVRTEYLRHTTLPYMLNNINNVISGNRRSRRLQAGQGEN